MSADNVETVKALLAVGFVDDDGAGFEFMDPEVSLDWSRSDGPMSGTYVGHEGVRRWADAFREVFEEYRMEPHEFISRGPHVVVPNTSHFRGRHGAEVIARGTLVYTLSNGKIVSITLFHDRDDALAAVGPA